MIIECPNCNKKFNLSVNLIPENGRTLKCGNCDHVWNYKINSNKIFNKQKISENKNTELDINISKKYDEINDKISNENISDINSDNKSEIKAEDLDVEKKDEYVKVEYEKGIKIKMIFIYIFILIISLFGLIFLLDTFKLYLSNIFPSIVPVFDSFYETLLDLKLFFKDLAN